jgi:tetratricopeptide (TPR) repeat protein
MNTPGSTSDLQTALQHTRQLLQSRPDQAEALAKDILRQIPDELNALFLLGAALRLQHKDAEAAPVLEKVLAIAPDYGVAHKDLGLSYLALDRIPDAIASLKKAVEKEPRIATAWRALGELLRQTGDPEEGRKANLEFLKLTVQDPNLIEASDHFFAGELRLAEVACRKTLDREPKNFSALQIAGEICSRMGNFESAEHFYKECLGEAPELLAARASYANTLFRLQKYNETLLELDTLLAEDPGNPAYQVLRATTTARLGRHEEALVLFQNVLDRFPDMASALLENGHALRAVGRQSDAIENYRRCIEVDPALGEAWFSLSNLKTVAFSQDDMDLMQEKMNIAELPIRDIWHLGFALGKAQEDERRFDEAFETYKRANAAKHSTVQYNPDHNHKSFEGLKAFFSREFFEAKERKGCDAPDPIFILGMPRAGSTMLEQILASHSQIEGTMELPDIDDLAKEVGGATGRIESLASWSNLELEVLGKSYLDRTRGYRSGLPYFVDKMPGNFIHIGMIHMILPNAKIIDARRHPIACCFSVWKQLFGKGDYTYDLENVGRFYRDYVSMMDHWDNVLPGRVLRVQYEDTVADLETQVRRVLDYCGLPFEEQCLRFHETERTVRTASSEQVRQPLHSDAIEHWRHFLPHLAPLIQSLGPVLDGYSID